MIRYVKALLVFVTTAIAVFASAAVVDHSGLAVTRSLSGSQQAWLASIALVWAPCIVYVVSSPVRWVEHLLRSEGAMQTTVTNDPELTRVERVAIWIAGAGWLLAAAAASVIVSDPSIEAPNKSAGLVFVAITATVMLGTLLVWRQRRRP